MLPWLGERFGNPSGAHRVARPPARPSTRRATPSPRPSGCRPGEVVFTSGGTEADNLAVAGVHGARPGPGLCSAIEHDAVLGPVAAVGGATVPVDADGMVDLDALDALLYARHHAGVRDGGQQRGRRRPAGGRGGRAGPAAGARGPPSTPTRCRPRRGCRWPTASPTPTSSASARTRSAAPRGSAPWSSRRGTPCGPRGLAAGQERELRSGTHDVAGIVGFAAALGPRPPPVSATAAATRARRDRLADGLPRCHPGPGRDRPAAPAACPAPSTCACRESRARRLLFLLDEAGVCASAASACASGAQQASHVLAAMGVPPSAPAGRCGLSLGLDHHRRRRRPGPRGRPGGRGPPAGGAGVKVLVAMSGGVDSSVAAARLLADGHDVVGVTMKLWGGESDTGVLLGERRRRRPPGGPAARHPPPRLELRRRLRGPRGRRPTSTPTAAASRPTRASSATAT